MTESAHQAGKPTPAELYAQARRRYQEDAEFHALVKTTANLLGWDPSILVMATHTMQLASELLEVSRSLQQEIANQPPSRRLDFYELSMGPHVMGPRCAVLGPTRTTCPGCGMGYIEEMSTDG